MVRIRCKEVGIMFRPNTGRYDLRIRTSDCEATDWLVVERNERSLIVNFCRMQGEKNVVNKTIEWNLDIVTEWSAEVINAYEDHAKGKEPNGN